MVPLLLGERVVLAIGGFLGLLGLERLRPIRPPSEPRWRRYLVNGAILGSNAWLLSGALSGLLIAAYRHFELQRAGLLAQLGIGGWWNAALTLVVLDGVTYWWHRAYHRAPLMWRMHRVHHSDRDLDVTTSGRFHLTEMLLSAAFRLAVIGAWGATLAGVVLFEIVFGFFNQLEHANLRLPDSADRWARRIVVTPAMHRVHHSQVPAHTNSNYGTIFSWWDRLFGSYRDVERVDGLVIGLPEYPRPADVTLGRVLAMPFGTPCGPGHRAGR